jgi:chromosome segregation ATPase
MSDDILSDAKKFAAQFGAFMRAAEMLGHIQSLDRATAEAQSRLDTIRREETQLNEKREAELREARARIVGAIEKDKQEAKNILDEAQRNAHRITQAAEQEAKALAKGIKDQAEKAAADAGVELRTTQQQVQQLRSTIGSLQESINERRQQLTDLTDQIRDATNRRAAADRKLEELRSTLGH